MAYNNNQSDATVPGGKENRRKSNQLLPRFFRTPTNNKFLHSTIDQLINPGAVEKISAYYGRKNAKAFLPSDNYIEEINANRQNYQLEPVVVRKDNLGNCIFLKDYVDYINQLNALGGNVDNHSVLNSQEYYAWDPHIDWDKFVNFREYYWMPAGPDPIVVRGHQQMVSSTYTVTLADNIDNYAYLLTPDGLTQNPTIKLFKGITYNFLIDTPNMPFTIRTARTLDDDFLYNTGVSQQGITNGTMTFTVDENTPDVLYYVSAKDINAYGLIQVQNIEDNSEFDVEKELLGKKTFVLNNGTPLSNGMRLQFAGIISPESYKNTYWYVEGVGEKIELIDEQTLRVPNALADDALEAFDEEGFDQDPFDIDDLTTDNKKYIVINRSAKDNNPWSRCNKWFHKSVLTATAAYNGVDPNVDESMRAKRPIIEFEGGLKLFNFGTQAKKYVDVVDTFTTDVFSTIEGSLGYNVDGVQLVDKMRLLVTADTDILVNNRIFEVNFINFANNNISNRQISLVEISDTAPLLNETVLVASGNNNAGKMYHYDGSKWKLSQQKTDDNFAPLFDLFDFNDKAFSDLNTYASSAFAGNKLFSYKVGTGREDTELGFALSYRNVNNVGDIVFDFNLLSDAFDYQKDDAIVSQSTNVGYLRKYSSRTDYHNVNGWTKGHSNSVQPVIRQYLGSEQVNTFEVDQYDAPIDQVSLKLKVFVDGKILPNSAYVTVVTNGKMIVQLNNDLTAGQSLVLKTISNQTKNANGYYEIPINLQNNPMNDDVKSFVFGEVSNHLDSIIENLDNFTGVNPGINNLRDQGSVSQYGTKFVQHSGPINLASYHLCYQQSNVIKSIAFAQKEYDKFKKIFLQTAENIEFSGTVRKFVDTILTDMNNNKNNKMPFYFSDMVPYSGAKETEFKVFDDSNKYFALNKTFDMSTLSDKAVGVYLNGYQLMHSQDYVFNADGFCVISQPLQVNDIVLIVEYESTNGSYVPPTPTKLGLYPRFKPTLYQDDTFQTPTNVIQGHDGSITVAYDDYRDDLLLELEKRIYNNIKISYDTDLRNIYDFIPSENRFTGVSIDAINKSITNDFIKWNNTVGNLDYSDHYFFDLALPFTYNHSLMQSYQENRIQGFWRSVYKYAYDTDRPHTHPWEILGYSEKPNWWDTVYGPAPYTRDNLILWEDIRDGIIREPDKKIIYLTKFARPSIMNHIPVDAEGKLLSPVESGYAQSVVAINANKNFIFGDHSPVESTWRRSSDFPFALLKAQILNRPAKTLGLFFDASRTRRDISNHIVYTESKKRLKLRDLVCPNTADATDIVYTSGLINYITNYISTAVSSNYAEYKDNLQNLTQQLGFKVKGFTTKEKFKLILDSRSPTSEGDVFIPEENYEIFLNSSTPFDLATYSAVLIEKISKGYVVKGYDLANAKFKYFPVVRLSDDPARTVGGITVSYVNWSPKKLYSEGTYVRYNNVYYTVNKNHQSGPRFEDKNFTAIAKLPVVGGSSAVFHRNFSKKVQELPYGTVLYSNQEVVDFLLGYGKYLESIGFIFNNFDKKIVSVQTWSLSAQEFLFWTTQSWATGAVITLSPGAEQLQCKKNFSVADNLFDNPYDSFVLSANGTRIPRQRLNVVRENNLITISTNNTNEGIYYVKIPFIHKEHIVLIDNVTVFNDVIYDFAPGYRQERIKVSGYVISDWDGSFSVPGFLYNEVYIKEWQAYKDYAVADVVKFKTFYYSAKAKVVGSENFDFAKWVRLDEKPSSNLTANWDYKANQFADFYDLDTDNFDTEQQKFGQHLIGYQKRSYLRNIINDDVAQYKFYQGFLKDKGTKNALDKLFNTLSNTGKDSLDFYEEWAIRTGSYGASEGYREVEYKLEEKKFKQESQPIWLTDVIENNEIDLIYRINSDQTYLKYDNYDHKPFLTNAIRKQVIKTAGHVDPADVQHIVKTFNDILNIDTQKLKFDQYVWVGFYLQSWQVYKHVLTNYKVLSVTESNNLVNVNIKGTADVSAGEIISVTLPKEQDDAKRIKLYKVKSVEPGKIICEKNGQTTITQDENDSTDTGYVGEFISAKLNDLFSINSSASEYKKFADGDLFWIDNDNTNDWIVLKNKKVWKSHQHIVNHNENSVDSYGSAIAVNSENNLLAVADKNLGIYVYARATDKDEFILRQVISPPTNLWTGNGDFGASLDISADGKYIVVGAPTASNVKSYYKGAYITSEAYDIGDIVQHDGQLWKVQSPVLGENPSVDFTTFDAAAFWSEAEYNDDNNSYPEIKQMVTGNYTFAHVSVNHILIRAGIEQYTGSAVGDTLVLEWNSQSTEHPVSNTPFNGAATGVDIAFIEAPHTIQAKIDDIINIALTISTAVVGDTIRTNEAEGEVAYIFTQGTQTIIYLTNVNGSLLDSGQIKLGDVPLGDYTRVFDEDFDSLGGWWLIDVPSPGTLSGLKDIKKTLVIRDIIKAGDPRTAFLYFNSLDTKTQQAALPAPVGGPATPASQLSILSYNKSFDIGSPGFVDPAYDASSGPQLDSRFLLRAPKALSDALPTVTYDEVGIWFNTIKTGTPLNVYEPLDLDLPFDKLNGVKEIVDKWNGFIRVEAQPDGLGIFYLPVIGDTVQDSGTGNQAEVAYVKTVGFNTLQIYIKNKTGVFTLGSDFGTSANLIRIGTPNRNIGPIERSELEDAVVGQLLVFDTPSDLNPDVLTEYMHSDDYEYFLYQDITQDGVSIPASVPSNSNRDYVKTFNIPVGLGYTSSYTSQGAFAVYERQLNGNYDLDEAYITPDVDDDTNLGTKILLKQKNNDYNLFVSTAVPDQSGRIHFVKKNTNKDWHLGVDPKYTGPHDVTKSYQIGDLVIYSNQVYSSLTNQGPSAFNSTFWLLQSEGIDFLGYVPNDSGIQLEGDSTIPMLNLENFGTSFDTNTAATVLCVAVQYFDEDDSSSPGENKAIVYRLIDGRYQYSQTLLSPDSDNSGTFANVVAVSDDGLFIAVGSPQSDVEIIDSGTVYIYKQTNGVFSVYQTLTSPQPKMSENFGNNLDFDGDTLVISSKLGDTELTFTLDDGTTFFDGNATTFNQIISVTGSIYVYERINNVMVYADEFALDDSTLENFGESVKIVNNHVYSAAPDYETALNTKGKIYDVRKDRGVRTWVDHKTPSPQVDINRIKEIYLYNCRSNQLITKLDYIDPVQGKIAGIADQEIYYKTPFDPAVYTNGDNSVTVDTLNSWNHVQVGRLWWDLSTIKFYEAYQNNIIFKNNYWNKIFPGSSVDVYEWVGSRYLPAQWSSLQGTKEGSALNISGVPKYGNNVYVQKQVYDFVAETFSNRYYYWVKNKKEVPNTQGRKIGALEVAQLIEDPKKQKYRFVALLTDNQFTLHNANALLSDADVAVNFQIRTIDNEQLNSHNQYHLISEGIAYSKPKKEIEAVWFNSLIGYDEKDRPVPDIEISKKYRYGTLRKPRQSWFVNRVEALKQVIERVNNVLIKNLITDTYDITALSASENTPSTVTRLYDLQKDTLADLAFVGTAKVEQAVLRPVIQNARIISVTILNPGRGYKVVPSFNIVDSTGSGADITATINLAGQIDSVTVNRTGRNYSTATQIQVRKFSVLIKNDPEAGGRWSIHSFNQSSKIWERIRVQKYDTKAFWNYSDWYADGFNQFTKIDFSVNNAYELQLIQDDVGDVVKVQNVGTGGWLLLCKKDNKPNVDYTVNYRTVGRQKGTIQFKSNLYDFNRSNVGYNSTAFDIFLYDAVPANETRIILETLRDKIFIKDLEVEYNKLFFSSMRYVLSEQQFVDWFFKSSFVRSQHNVGELQQKPVYKNDNLISYKSYIDEAKPFKTKIREYVSAYEAVEDADTLNTDFDLPATYNAATRRIEVSTGKLTVSASGVPQLLNPNLVDTYPNKHWLDNVGFKITKVSIQNAGSGYLGIPVVTLTGGGGTGATAVAAITNGRVSSITVTNPGTGYLSAPTVYIQGPLLASGVTAKAYAVLGDSVIKSTHIRVKFDRTTGSLFITNLARTENFIGSGSQLKFTLKWPINLRSNKIKVIVDQRTSLSSEYEYNNENNTEKSYLRQKGFVQFIIPPKSGSAIQIQYEIDSSVLHTQDRVNLLYKPTDGMPGTDLGQLIDGIDYGGVEVRSLDFGGGTGWDADPYFTTTWDTYDTTFEDEVFRLDGSTNHFYLDQPLAAGVHYNIYKNGVRIDDPNYGTPSPVTNPNALMKTIIGDGSTAEVHIDEQLIPTVANDLIVIRKSTSDGSFLPDPDAYDTLLSGGDLAYSTAQGVLSQEIIVDGDGFVTPTTSKGPEELVPGQVLDTVDIQVYDRSGETGSMIASYNYKGDDSTSIFAVDSLPQSQEGVFVKINNVIQDYSAYTLNYANKTLVLNTAPAMNSKVNIITMSINGERIVDVDQFTGDGSTFIFVTRAKYVNALNSFVKVNGQDQQYVIDETDSSYQFQGMALIRFGVAPAIGSVITYVIYASVAKSFSEVTHDDFTGDGSTTVYTLSQSPFNHQPLTHQVVVKVANSVLNAGYNERFDVTAARDYFLNTWQLAPSSILNTSVKAFLNNVELLSPTQFRWNSANSSVTLETGIGTTGDQLKVYVVDDGDYIVNNNTITFDTAPALGASIRIWQFSNHDVLGSERINYDVVARDSLIVNTENYFEYQNLTNGIIRLREPAIDAQYAWVSINGVTLSPSVDYKISNNQNFIKINTTIQANDVIDVIHFTAPKYVGKFGFRQFKDMLNRVSYLRMGNDQKYFLSQTLHYYSQEIFLNSTQGLYEPNTALGRPGVLFINGERIEYFRLYSNRVGQLRRGTLGTGISTVHEIGTEVFDQSAFQVAPYRDETVSEVFVSDGSTENLTLSWIPLSANEFEVFVSGRRLRKNAISSYNPTLGMDSNEGDQTLPAEFTVSGSSTTLALAVAPAAGTKIIVVRRLGKLWNGSAATLGDTPLSQTENDIARFLRAKQVSLP